MEPAGNQAIDTGNLVERTDLFGSKIGRARLDLFIGFGAYEFNF